MSTIFIARGLADAINEKLTAEKNKVIVIMGARQVGKTSLVREILRGRDDVLWLSGDEPDTIRLFSDLSAVRFQAFAGNRRIAVVDEAQRIPDIGLRLKLLIDQLPDLRLIAAGSSSFELANRTNEPLTGRKWEYRMFPLSFSELVRHHGLLTERRLLPHRLVFGSYPEVVTSQGMEEELLKGISESCLYRDVLAAGLLKKPDHLVRLLQALAWQIGSRVSWTEVGQLCGLDYKTIEKYVLILEQSYVIFRLGSFSRNLRNELKNTRKVFFHDNGIRNAVISDFTPLENRSDAGALWENYLISERMKLISGQRLLSNGYFWRTHQQNEIDYVEENGRSLSACEFKWNEKAKVRTPKAFLEAYPNSTFRVIHPGNYDEFLLPGK